MRRRNILLALFVAVAVIGGMAWMIFRPSGPPEPVYQGKRVSKWLALMRPGVPPLDPGAVQAVRQIGTNGIPTYLRMLQAHDSDFKLKLIGLTRKQRLIKINLIDAEDRNWEAVQAFTILGASASNAVPALIHIHKENISDVNRQFTARALGGIGPAAREAVPVLLSNAVDTSVIATLGAKDFAIYALGKIHTDPDLVVPVLIKCLKDPQPMIQVSAAQALVNFGNDAKPAVSALVELLNAPEVWVRPVATQALKAIDPEAAAKAGIK